MPFFKKKSSPFSIGSVPIITPIVQRSKTLGDDKIVSVIESVVNIDVNDPANYPVFPDVDEFNNLEMQLASGVVPKPVSTVQIVSDNVAGDSAVSDILDNISIEPVSDSNNPDNN